MSRTGCSCFRYASEVDVDFVRKAVRAIGQVAIKIEAAAERAVGVLMELIDTRVSYVVQEGVIVIKVRISSPQAQARRRYQLCRWAEIPRISSGSILTLMKASSRHYAAT